MDNLSLQQQAFLKAFLDPKSPTWGNYLQSGLKAGYSQEYSESISYQMPDWLSESLGDSKLVQKALKNLEMALEGMLDDPEGGSKNIQWKSTETTLKALLNQKFGDKKTVDLTSGGEKITMTPEKLALTQEYEKKLKEEL